MSVFDETDWRRVPKACMDGCQLTEARKLLVTAERLVGRTTEGKTVSQALWCDQGDHAFSARDPKSEHWERQVKNDKGENVTVPWDVCGQHVAAINERLAAMDAEVQQRAKAPAAQIPPADSPGVAPNWP